MPLTWPVNSSIVVVGGGASGTLTATRLLDEANRRHRPLVVHLVDPRPAGQGVAYSTTDDRHLLNVQARAMSAYPEDPDHFLRWLSERVHGAVDPCAFVARSLYGRYLQSVLNEAARRTPWARLHRVRDCAVDVRTSGTRCTVVLSGGTELAADAVVLAVGHLGSATGWAPSALLASDRFVVDPWAPGALAQLPAGSDVLIVGTGLTMVDVARSLDRPGRVVHAVSRSGRLPHRHLPGTLPRMEAPELPERPTLPQLRKAMERHVSKAVQRYGDWRPAIDSIRAITPTLWKGLSEPDRAEFLATQAREWETLRHRMAPPAAAAVDAARDGGRLTIRAAEVTEAAEEPDGLTVSLTDGTTLRVGAVVNCTGPGDRPAETTHPLVRRLMASGLARSGSMGLGLDTTADGRLRDGAGTADGLLWALGPLRRGAEWETTAVPEIRVQAKTLAEELVGAATGHRSPTRDSYGLPLSTTSEAAAAWAKAVSLVQRMQPGAEAALRDAAAADPGFAMAHAGLALLGHEGIADDVDISLSLARAREAVALRGDDRERSFVHLVAARVLGSADAGDEALRRHIARHPRDVLAVSAALPTIAFGGLAQPPEASWALAEQLAPTYGEDWWFLGVLSFLRQEQNDWNGAERLATRSLELEPGSGHAAHARAHVHYETGQHRAGLCWLDGWIRDHAPTSTYRSHFSWHAGLHELALDDAEAVRRRYADQLTPPLVTGARALVDSASLLWRSRLGGCWPDDLPIEDLLEQVPHRLLERPATAFCALHAVVALAAARDVEGIERLRLVAQDHPDPVFREVLTHVCDGFAAHVRGELGTAADALLRAVPQMARVKGSAAQQEVVEDTLIDALVGSGRCREATSVLQARLDRRPHPNDARRLAAVVPSLARTPT